MCARDYSPNQCEDKRKRCQDAIDSLNMLQVWNGEVLDKTYNLKGKTEYTGCQEGNRTLC
jgi:hypothetical protein